MPIPASNVLAYAAVTPAGSSSASPTRAPLEMVRSPALAASGIDDAQVRFTDLRQLGGRIERREAALLALARAMVFWHARHRFCGVCGSPTRSEEAGHMRRCTDPAC